MFLFTDFLWFPVTLLAIFVFAKVFRRQSVNRRYPPSLPSLPLVGSLPFIWKFDNTPEFFMSKVHQLGPIYTFREGRRLCLTLNNRETIEEALVKNSTCFAGRSSIYMERIVNKNHKGILGSDFTDDFKRYHKLTLSVLTEFGFGIKPLMERRILEEFEAMNAFIRAKHGKKFNPIEMTQQVTYNVMKNIVLGKRQDYDNGHDELIKNLMLFGRNLTVAIDVAPALLKLLPYFSRKMKVVGKSLSRICEIVEEEIENIRKNGRVKCFVSSYLAKVGPDYDQEQLVYTIKDLLGGGSQTTGTLLLWFLVFIANNPAIQKRLQKEIDEVIPRHRLPSLDDQPKLPFVEATILEIMRFRAPLPISLPRLTLTDSEVCGYFIPAGTKVFPNLYAAHMDPKVWKDPDVFRPERFLDEDNNIVGREEVISFSLGRRSCIAEVLARQEIFLFIACWIQRFYIQPGEDGQKIEEKPIIGIVMKSQPFQIRMIPRET